MGTIVHDLRHGVRLLLKSPAFTAATVIVLALGIGANTAIFTVVNAVLLRPLPFQEPERLVQIWHMPPAKSFPGMTQFAVSAANYLDWRRENHVFEKTAIYAHSTFDLTGGDRPESVMAGAVEPNFFSVFGVQPILGRAFRPEEDQAGHNTVVILSYGLWQSRFGSNPKIVGETITLNGGPYTVVGVMGPKFCRPDWARIWTPLAWTDKERAVRGEHHYSVVGRLKPGVDLRQAQAEMDTISRRLEQQYPADNKGWGAVVVPLREELVGEVRPALLILLGAVAFVLLIACANVANLVLAKSFARRKEIAVRTALGASRGRVMQQIMSETVVVSIAGGALGLLVANFGVTLIEDFLAARLPRSADIALDTRVLGFTFTIAVGAGVLAGLAPAWRLAKTNVNEALKQGLGRTDSDGGGSRARSALVIVEVALSLMLLIGAGLMIRSLWMLRNVDPGFDPQNVLTMTVSVPPTKFPLPSHQYRFFERVLEQVRSLPGIESAGVIDDLPVVGGGSIQPIAFEGRPAAAMADQPEVSIRAISPAYLRALRIPLMQGRAFDVTDTADSHAVVLISESMAKRFWPNQDPIGKHLILTFFPQASREIVGVVGDVKQWGLDVAEPVATLYVPLSQLSAPAPAMGGWRSFPMSLVVHTSSAPQHAVSEVIGAVHQIDSTAPVLDVMTMEDVLSSSLSQRRFNMLLLAAFAGLALLLAATGIYTVLSYSVRRRVQEIGIRMALGAQVSEVLRLIVVEGMKPTLIGMAIGLAGALALGRVLANLLYGVRVTDILTFVAVAALLGTVGLCAAIIPAYRATTIDPMQALRDE